MATDSNVQSTSPTEDDDEVEVAPFEAGEKLESLESGGGKDDPLPTEKEDVLDILEPKSAPKHWVFNSPLYGERDYWQKELSFLGKLEWGAELGVVLDKAMSGPNPLSLKSLMEVPQGLRPGQPVDDDTDFTEIDVFVQALGKLVASSPEFLKKSYAIWLNVPPYDREPFYEIITASPSDGGLTDEQGFEMMEIFVDQNWAAIQQIFTDRMGKLRKRAEAKATTTK